MFENEIQPRPESANLKNYEEACKSFSWDQADKDFSWHRTGKVNIAHEAIDRHAEDPAKAGLNCIIYSHGSHSTRITYEQMRLLSNRFGNVLRSLGVGKGDRVFIFLPSVPELYIAMVGCAKIGAVIVPFYSNYREGAVRERMLDAKGKALVTTTRHLRRVPVDEIPDLEHIIIVDKGDRDSEDEYVLWETEMARASDELAVEWVDREFPLFMIYTSGEHGRSVGLLHPHDAMRGYLMTARWVLDLQDGDVLWTQGQPGWFMNVVYSAFAPWLCGVESFVTGMIKSAEELYRNIEEHGITVLYTIPTLYRMIIKAGDDAPKQFNVKTLRHLLSVLEPLFPDVIYAVMRITGLPVYDTWWSAETGMITIANLLCMPLKPGYLGKGVPGVEVAVLDAEGNEAPPFTMGEIAIKTGWPCMARSAWENDRHYRRYIQHEPWFMCGDTAFVDFDHYMFYQGRADDVIITSAGKTGLAEIENILQRHPAIAEAGIIRVPGKEGIKKTKAYIRLKPSYKPTDLLKKKLMAFVKKNLAYDTAPREIEFCETLPKDKNGQLLRRVLKAWELGLPVGDIS